MQKDYVCKECEYADALDEKMCVCCNIFRENATENTDFTQVIDGLEVSIILNKILFITRDIHKSLYSGIENNFEIKNFEHDLTSLVSQLQKSVMICERLGRIKIEQLFANKTFLRFHKWLHENSIITIGDIFQYEHEKMFLKKVKGLGESKKQEIISRLKYIVRLYLCLSGNDLIECKDIKNYYPFLDIKKDCEFLSLKFFTAIKLTAKTIAELDRYQFDKLEDLRFLHVSDIVDLANDDNNFLMMIAEYASISLEHLLERFFKKENQDRDTQVFLLRAEGETLQTIGDQYGITREGTR